MKIDMFLKKKTVKIETSPNSTTNQRYTFNGKSDRNIRAVYVARWEKDAKTEFNKDYFVTVVGGGVGRNGGLITLDFLVNPTNEPMSFEIQLIG